SRSDLRVTNVFAVPRHFFIPTLVEERKPLAITARRAGWIGCNINIGRIPDFGKVFIVRQGLEVPRDEVLALWQRTLFLKDQATSNRGWLLEVLSCVERIGSHEFTLADVYSFESHLKSLFPGNMHL